MKFSEEMKIWVKQQEVRMQSCEEEGKSWIAAAERVSVEIECLQKKREKIRECAKLSKEEEKAIAKDTASAKEFWNDLEE